MSRSLATALCHAWCVFAAFPVLAQDAGQVGAVDRFGRDTTANAADVEPSDERLIGTIRVRRGNGPLNEPGDVDPSVEPGGDDPNAGQVDEPSPAPVDAAPPLPEPAVDDGNPKAPHRLFEAIKRSFEVGFASAKTLDEADRKALSEFYIQRGGEPLWLDGSSYNQAAKSVIEEMANADDWGLAASAYVLPAIAAAPDAASTDDQLAESEIKLSLLTMAYARHARGDRITDPTTQLSSYIDRKPQLIERHKLLVMLSVAPEKDTFLRSLHPKHLQFERLRQKLLDVRSGRQKPQPPKLDIGGRKLLPGRSDPQVVVLRERLRPAGAQSPDVGPEANLIYDAALAEAVIAFKVENNIEPADGIVNDATRRALNRDDRIDEQVILANMEQWRWMPQELGQTHIDVNIPEFMVRVIKDGKVVHAERIVTGQRSTQTPVFSDEMRTVVFQPVWNVPQSIKVNEILPGLQSGRNSIAGRGLVLSRNGRPVNAMSIDWSRADIRNYDVYQPPGSSNALGVVKFLFPNKHSVYLHDTPSKSLFNESVRAFSHGCMRVRNPVRLAEVIMQEDKGWPPELVADVLRKGPENNDVALEKPIPVHVTYFTMSIDDDGQVKTFGDVYGHEQRVKLALAGRWKEIERNTDHLLPATPQRIARARPKVKYRDQATLVEPPRGNSFFAPSRGFSAFPPPSSIKYPPQRNSFLGSPDDRQQRKQKRFRGFENVPNGW